MAYDIFGNPVDKPSAEEIEAGRRLRNFYVGVAVGFLIAAGIFIGL